MGYIFQFPVRPEEKVLGFPPHQRVVISKVKLIKPIYGSQWSIARAPDGNSAEIVYVFKVRIDDSRAVFLIFDERAERIWSWYREEPGWVWDEHAQERKQRILVLITETDVAPTESER